MRNLNFILNTFRIEKCALCGGNPSRAAINAALHWCSPYALVAQLIGPNIELSDRTFFKANAFQMSGRSDLDQFKLFYSLFRGWEWRSLCHPQINGSLFFVCSTRQALFITSRGATRRIPHQGSDKVNNGVRRRAKCASSRGAEITVAVSRKCNFATSFYGQNGKNAYNIKFLPPLIDSSSQSSRAVAGAICVFKSFLIVSFPIEIDTCPPVQLDCISMSTDANRTKKMMRSSSLDF